MELEQIREESIEFARANRKEIAAQLASTEKYPPELSPVSVFMAGSPGA